MLASAEASQTDVFEEEQNDILLRRTPSPKSVSCSQMRFLSKESLKLAFWPRLNKGQLSLIVMLF